MAEMSSEAFEGTYRPVPEGKSLRLPFSSRLHVEGNDNMRLTDRLVGDALGRGGLGRYMDQRVVGAARREIEEAYSIDDRDIDMAADSYMQHVGMNDIRDFNEYSRSSLLRPAQVQQSQSQESSGSQDDLLLVTTL